MPQILQIQVLELCVHTNIYKTQSLQTSVRKTLIAFRAYNSECRMKLFSIQHRGFNSRRQLFDFHEHTFICAGVTNG
jgi:hypothetical protein